MEKINFVFLHGFLGQVSDWDPVISGLKNQFPESTFAPLDYFSLPPLSPKSNFDKWTEHFMDHLGAEYGDEPVILAGYSLGGRLALQALKKRPERFVHTFLLSTNPGFNEDAVAERDKRLAQDQQWAQRFLTDEWQTVIKDWNAQAVFSGARKEPDRLEVHFRRDLLARALTEWSPARQENLKPVLMKNQKKISWVVGDLDQKYMQITREIFKSCSDMSYIICPNSSHRVLFDNPEEVARSIVRSLRKAELIF